MMSGTFLGFDFGTIPGGDGAKADPFGGVNQGGVQRLAGVAITNQTCIDRSQHEFLHGITKYQTETMS